MNTDEPQFAFIYCRIACSDLRASGAAFDLQERACRAYAAGHGLDVIGVFKDIGSGYTDHMPDFNAMVDRLEPGMSVVVQDISRLGRAAGLVSSARQKLDASGCCLHLVAGKLARVPRPSAQILSTQVTP